MEYRNHSIVELNASVATDERVVHAARVSTIGQLSDGTLQPLPTETEGLINYLMQHRHGTPFEHTFFCFFVQAPIFVWREWHRHRIGFSYNEESARYKVLDPIFYLPTADRPMMKVDSWKPGRPKFTEATTATHDQLCENLTTSYEIAYSMYLNNLELNVDPGLARDCLPVGIFSSCWVSCNARSLMAFLSLRTHYPDAAKVSYPLYEIDQAAHKVETFFQLAMPLTHAAFVKHGRQAP